MANAGPITGNVSTDRADAPRPGQEGRLGVYAALGGSAKAIPLPWVPGAALERVRGALLADIAASYGLSLTREARAELSSARSAKAKPRIVVQALRMAAGQLAYRTLRTLGPMGLVVPLRGALQTYVLGRLFERYLRQRARRANDRGAIIEADEASRIRAAVDGAFVHAVAVVVEGRERGSFIGDPLDPSATLIDRVFQRLARVPAHLTQRLDTAFDDLIEHDRT
jgi:hypothetical protein